MRFGEFDQFPILFKGPFFLFDAWTKIICVSHSYLFGGIKIPFFPDVILDLLPVLTFNFSQMDYFFLKSFRPFFCHSLKPFEPSHALYGSCSCQLSWNILPSFAFIPQFNKDIFFFRAPAFSKIVFFLPFELFDQQFIEEVLFLIGWFFLVGFHIFQRGHLRSFLHYAIFTLLTAGSRGSS